jgi:hypothetical protein
VPALPDPEPDRKQDVYRTGSPVTPTKQNSALDETLGHDAGVMLGITGRGRNAAPLNEGELSR